MKMQDIKVPGVLWTVLIVVAVAVAHRYLTDPIYVEMVIILAFAIAKSLNLGTEEIDALLAIIGRLRVAANPSASRGMTDTEKDILMDKSADALISELTPNKVTRWLLG